MVVDVVYVNQPLWVYRQLYEMDSMSTRRIHVWCGFYSRVLLSASSRLFVYEQSFVSKYKSVCLLCFGIIAVSTVIGEQTREVDIKHGESVAYFFFLSQCSLKDICCSYLCWYILHK